MCGGNLGGWEFVRRDTSPPAPLFRREPRPQDFAHVSNNNKTKDQASTHIAFQQHVRLSPANGIS